MGNDFDTFLSEIGLTRDDIARVMNDSPDDYCPLSKSEAERVGLFPSNIHGVGLFAVREFKMGEPIAVAYRDGAYTQAGRYINHAKYPNTYFEAGEGGDHTLIAAHPILSGSEFTVNYRQVKSTLEANKNGSNGVIP